MRFSIAVWPATPFLLFLAVLWCCSAWGATPYKTYVVKEYKNWDILCDPYTVQEGDCVWELLRRRGHIVEWDTAWFTALLKRLNAHVRNVDQIYPGQQILIPLKRMEPQEGAAGANDRSVTIPFLPDILYSTYTVQPGEYIAQIAARHHGLSVDQIPEGYFQAVKQVNPGVTNLDRIYPGQKIRIPELASGSPREIAPFGPPSAGGRGVRPSPRSPARRPPQSSAISMGAKRLGGTFIESGHYFFPLKEKSDFKLDLSVFPVIELAGGRRLLLDRGNGLSREAENAIRASWRSLTIVRAEPGESRRTLLNRIFRTIYGEEVRQTLSMPISEDGIQVTLRGDWIIVQDKNEQRSKGYDCITLISDDRERTSAALRDYLAERSIRISDLLPEGGGHEGAPEDQESDSAESPAMTLDASKQEAFVAALSKALGYSYNPRVPLSFKYAGSQVKTVIDLINGEGLDAVVDFGTFYGDAKSAIEASGLKVLSIRPGDEALSIARKLLRTAGIAWTEDPVFFGANRSVFKTTSLTVPGLLTSRAAGSRTLLTPAPLPPKACNFLSERKIKVLKIGSR
jgi:LysM repeat protein